MSTKIKLKPIEIHPSRLHLSDKLKHISDGFPFKINNDIFKLISSTMYKLTESGWKEHSRFGVSLYDIAKCQEMFVEEKPDWKVIVDIKVPILCFIKRNNQVHFITHIISYDRCHGRYYSQFDYYDEKDYEVVPVKKTDIVLLQNIIGEYFLDTSNYTVTTKLELMLSEGHMFKINYDDGVFYKFENNQLLFKRALYLNWEVSNHYPRLDELMEAKVYTNILDDLPTILKAQDILCRCPNPTNNTDLFAIITDYDEKTNTYSNANNAVFHQVSFAFNRDITLLENQI